MLIRLIVKFIGFVFFSGWLAGCAHSVDKSSSADLASLMADQKVRSGLTEDQSVHLEQYLYRNSSIDNVDDYFYRDADFPNAKTIEDAVIMQRKYLDNHELYKEKNLKISRELKNNRYQLFERIKKALEVNFIDKKVSDGASGDEVISLKLWMKNNSGKDISLVKGKFVMLTKDGVEVAKFKVVNHQYMRNGNSLVWTGSVSLVTDPSGLINKRFSKMESNSYSGVWVPESILFSDRSVLSISD